MNYVATITDCWSARHNCGWLEWNNLTNLFYLYLFVYLTCTMHNKDIVPEIAKSHFFIVSSFIGSIELKWGFWLSMLLWWSLLPWPLISSKGNHLCIWASCCQHFTSCGTSWRGWSHLAKRVQNGIQKRFGDIMKEPELIAAAILLPRFRTSWTTEENILNAGKYTCLSIQRWTSRHWPI